ncbi:GYF domain containing protein [Reticulomyxa filosa]|uniref:GYF domain containing protein n=1 Tax=Reticulomyxa filosa TaxID=46433 RepID=X6MT70_RETFI|nr:GYF domain containing protein [Reticulomyxa filosa]|eukprot:ETO16841.1 GYF domain containing protein [Reticulomyxa filosa]
MSDTSKAIETCQLPCLAYEQEKIIDEENNTRERYDKLDNSKLLAGMPSRKKNSYCGYLNVSAWSQKNKNYEPLDKEISIKKIKRLKNNKSNYENGDLAENEMMTDPNKTKKKTKKNQKNQKTKQKGQKKKKRTLNEIRDDEVIMLFVFIFHYCDEYLLFVMDTQIKTNKQKFISKQGIINGTKENRSPKNCRLNNDERVDNVEQFEKIPKKSAFEIHIDYKRKSQEFSNQKNVFAIDKNEEENVLGQTQNKHLDETLSYNINSTNKIQISKKNIMPNLNDTNLQKDTAFGKEKIIPIAEECTTKNLEIEQNTNLQQDKRTQIENYIFNNKTIQLYSDNSVDLKFKCNNNTMTNNGQTFVRLDLSPELPIVINRKKKDMHMIPLWSKIESDKTVKVTTVDNSLKGCHTSDKKELQQKQT